MLNKTFRKAHRCECAECQRHPRGEMAELHRSLNRVIAALDEKKRRLVAGIWALRLGRGGIQRVAEITGLSRPTIARGQREARQVSERFCGRVRRPGGGRPRVEKNNLAF
jgi:predicted mannosyl-3-phosphoglycerate phosphatase (HAD superfamily)